MTEGFFLLKQIKVNDLGYPPVACHIQVQIVGIYGLRIFAISYYEEQ
jgi:hypothetical protein